MIRRICWTTALLIGSSSRRRHSSLPVVSAFSAVQREKNYSQTFSCLCQSMAKLNSPSAQRNKDPIWNIIESKIVPRLAPESLTVSKDKSSVEPSAILEIACGAGIHTHYFSTKLLETNDVSFRWYPADMDDAYRASTQAFVSETPGLAQVVQTPYALTLNSQGILEQNVNSLFRSVAFELILNINMIHISPWEATVGLMKVAGEKLNSGGTLFLYGPYKVNGEMVESNRNFDDSLKSRDSRWGIKDLEAIMAEAEKNQLDFVEKIEMPANNLVVLFRKK